MASEIKQAFLKARSLIEAPQSEAKQLNVEGFQFEDIDKTLLEIRGSIETALSQNVPRDLVENRVAQLLLSGYYPVRAFILKPNLPIPSQITSTWITEQLFEAHRSQYNSIHNDTFQITMQELFSGESGDQMLSNILAEINTSWFPKKKRASIAKMFQFPTPSSLGTVQLWNQTISDGTEPIGIMGHDRRGVAGLRRIFMDLEKLRTNTDKSNNKKADISGDSWMFVRPRNMELIFGKPIDELMEAGVSWVGSIDILKPETMAQERLRMITNPHRLIASTVFALSLRDSYIHQFIEKGIYPEMGSFRMPRSVFFH